MSGVDDFVFIYLFIEVKNKCRISGYLQDNSTHVVNARLMILLMIKSHHMRGIYPSYQGTTGIKTT